jgi:hypothetical protein
MKKLFALCLTLAVLASCDKDKFETKPQVRVLSTSGKNIPSSADLRVTLEVTDKEGDVDDSLYIVRERLNRKGFSRVVLPYKLPQYPAGKSRVEFETILTYATELTFGMSPVDIPGTGNKNEIDTLRLKFVVKDRAGNKSDTAILDDVYVTR